MAPTDSGGRQSTAHTRFFRKWPPFRAAPMGCQGQRPAPLLRAPLAARKAERYTLPRSTAEPAMIEFLGFISYLLTLYVYVLIASADLSWLNAINVVNARNPLVQTLGEFLYRVSEPLLRPIRILLPNLGGIDVSPVILLLFFLFIQSVVFPVLARHLV